jgi:hypothetical protein
MDSMGAICTRMPRFVHVPRVVPLHISLSVMAISSLQYADWLNWNTSALAKHYFNSSTPSSAQVVTSPWRIVSVINGCNSPFDTKSEDIYSTIDYRARYPWCLSGVCPNFRQNTTSFIIICQFFIKIHALPVGHKIPDAFCSVPRFNLLSLSSGYLTWTKGSVMPPHFFFFSVADNRNDAPDLCPINAPAFRLFRPHG